MTLNLAELSKRMTFNLAELSIGWLFNRAEISTGWFLTLLNVLKDDFILAELSTG